MVFVLTDLSLFPDHRRSPSELAHRSNMNYKQGVSRVCKDPIYPALEVERAGIAALEPHSIWLYLNF